MLRMVSYLRISVPQKLNDVWASFDSVGNGGSGESDSLGVSQEAQGHLLHLCQ